MRKIKCGYQVKCDWPEDCSLQGNESGLVVSRKSKSTRKTAFFEAFPQKPNNCFIRGEGETLQQAEETAFEIFKKIDTCPKHVFERLSDKGRGKCTSCGMKKTDALPSIFKCLSCECAGVENEIYDGPGFDANVIAHMCNACYFNTYVENQTDSIIGSVTSRKELDAELSLHNLDLIRAYFYREHMKEANYRNSSDREQNSNLERLSRLHYHILAQLKETAITYLLLNKDQDYCECFDNAATEEIFILNSSEVLEQYAKYFFAIRMKMDAGDKYDQAFESLLTEWQSLVSNFVIKIEVSHVEYELLKVNNPDFEKRTRLNTREETVNSFRGMLTALSGVKST